MLSGIGRSITNLLFPARCLGCGRVGSLLCDRCVMGASRLAPPFCLRCGRPLGAERGDSRLSRTGSCSLCRESPSSIYGIRSAYLFTGVIRKAIHEFKYRGVFSLAPVLSHLLADYIRNSAIKVDMIVPVPLHRQRRKERGYDQAELLASHLAGEVGLPLGRGWLIRVRATVPQVKTASAAERRRNILGAFAAGSGVEGGCSVLLVDDVCTTGATLEACAAVLHEAGVARVWGLTLAREP